MCEITDMIVLTLLVACAVCDWKKKEIPLLLLVVMSGVIGICVLFCHEENLWQHVGGAGIGVLFFLISKLTKEAIGYGDSWLILLLGIYLGVSKVIQLLFAASLLAGVCSIFLLWKKHWKKNITIPFVPFMAVVFLGVMFL